MQPLWLKSTSPISMMLYFILAMEADGDNASEMDALEAYMEAIKRGTHFDQNTVH